MRKRTTEKKAFTLVELVAVMGVMALLAMMTLPAWCGTRARSTRTQCMDNVRQLELATLLYASQFNDALPFEPLTGSWAWDTSVATVSNIMQNGAARGTFYCPAFPDMNNDYLWSSLGNYRVIGYARAFNETVGIVETNYNLSVLPQPLDINPGPLPAPVPSQRMLWADGTISQAGQFDEIHRTNNTYIGIRGGWVEYHRTAHLISALPAGGNVGMLDGHVEWRDFQNMHVRTVNDGAPEFWW